MTDQTDCTGCPLVDRRDFVRSGVMAALAIVGVPSLGEALARNALSLTDIEPRATHGPTRTYSLPSADGVQIDRSAGIIVARWQDVVYAFDLSCPHQNTALRWDDRDKHFRCPKHKSEYDPTGQFLKGRATRGMDRLAISQNGANEIVVDSSRRYEQDRDPANWNAATIHLS
jgi:Rieske Fe-S protein